METADEIKAPGEETGESVSPFDILLLLAIGPEVYIFHRSPYEFLMIGGEKIINIPPPPKKRGEKGHLLEGENENIKGKDEILAWEDKKYGCIMYIIILIHVLQ